MTKGLSSVGAAHDVLWRTLARQFGAKDPAAVADAVHRFYGMESMTRRNAGVIVRFIRILSAEDVEGT